MVLEISAVKSLPHIFWRAGRVSKISAAVRASEISAAVTASEISAAVRASEISAAERISKISAAVLIKVLRNFCCSKGVRNFCGRKGLRNLYVLIVPEIFVDRCPRNFSGPLFQKFLWILVSEISADESLSQKFLRVSRCQRSFCGSWKLYFLSCVFVNVLQTSETTVINAYRQETNKF